MEKIIGNIPLRSILCLSFGGKKIKLKSLVRRWLVASHNVKHCQIKLNKVNLQNHKTQGRFYSSVPSHSIKANLPFNKSKAVLHVNVCDTIQTRKLSLWLFQSVLFSSEPPFPRPGSPDLRVDQAS